MLAFSEPGVTTGLTYLDMVLNVLFAIDIGVNFCTAY
jgi:hypothetical protein